MSGPFTWTFTTDATQPAVSSHTPASSATGVAVSTAPTAVFNEAVQSNSITMTLATSSAHPWPAQVSYNSANETVTFTPSAGAGVCDDLHRDGQWCQRHRGRFDERPRDVDFYDGGGDHSNDGGVH